MSYEERKYRNILNRERFEYFNVVHLETDLWIGLSKSAPVEELTPRITQDIISLRRVLDDHIRKNPEFATSYTPLDSSGSAPDPVKRLLVAGKQADTGPMAGIAGLFSEHIGRKILEYTPGTELLVENGGDIFCSVNSPILISIYAGSSVLSNKIGLNIAAGKWGICTSSGTVGHSTSLGKADAVTVVAKDTVLADALATRIANEVKSADDVQRTTEAAANYTEIEGAVIICRDKIGLSGDLEVLPVTSM